MMSGSDMNLFIAIGPSRELQRLSQYLWLTCFTCVVAYGLMTFSIMTNLLLLSGILLPGIPLYRLQQQLLNKLNQGVTEIQFIDGLWYIVQTETRSLIELADNNVVWPRWIRLRYQVCVSDNPSQEVSRRHKDLLLWRDAVSDEDFRHLSRTLRYYRQE